MPMLTVTSSTRSAPRACLASAATVVLSRPPLKATTTGLASATVWMSSTRVRTRLSVPVNAGIARPCPSSIKETSLPSLPSLPGPLQLRDRNGILAGGLGRLGRPGRPGRLLLVKPDRLLRGRGALFLRDGRGVPRVEDPDDPPAGGKTQELAQRWMVPERSSPEVGPNAQTPRAQHERIYRAEGRPVVLLPQLGIVMAHCRDDDDHRSVYRILDDLRQRRLDLGRLR